MNYCGQCGARVPAGSQFCGACGAQVAAASQAVGQASTSTPGTTTPPLPAPATHTVAPARPMLAPPLAGLRKRRHRWRYVVGTIVGLFVALVLLGSLLPPTPTPRSSIAPVSSPTSAPVPTRAPIGTPQATLRASGSDDITAWAGVLSNSLDYCDLATGARPWSHMEMTLSSFLSGSFSVLTARGICHDEADQLRFDTPPVSSRAVAARLDHARALLEQWAISVGNAAGDNLGTSDNTPDQATQDERTQAQAIIVDEAKKEGIVLDPDTLLPPGQPLTP